MSSTEENADEEDCAPPECFPADPNPYTISGLRWFTDVRGERHYY